MQACDGFEDRLLGYSELSVQELCAVDAHVAVCEDCRDFLASLEQVDRDLSALYSGIEPRRSPLPRAVFARPSALPEVLDFCGWAAVVAAIVLLGIMFAQEFGIRLLYS